MGRITIARYLAPALLWMRALNALETGYAADTVVLDGTLAVPATRGEHARPAPAYVVAAERAEAG